LQNSLKRVWSLMFLSADSAGAGSRSSLEQFAVPYMFAPRLSLAGAAFAVLGAVARMFLGSALFAVWGAYSFHAWQSMNHALPRVLLAAASLGGFLAAFASLMIAISLFLRKLQR
jgi:hypothetical protein